MFAKGSDSSCGDIAHEPKLGTIGLGGRKEKKCSSGLAREVIWACIGLVI